MIRTIIAIVASVLIVTMTAVTWAQDITSINVLVNNADDYEAVRKVIRKEIQGWFKNDPEQVFSVFDADNVFGIGAGGSSDPKEWVISTSGRADIRAYADGVEDSMTNVPDGYRHNAEVQHVHIKGDHALAVARQWIHQPDEVNNRTVDGQFETVWILKRTGGEWKIIGYIGQVSSNRVVTEN